jgi:hypothetical protein
MYSPPQMLPTTTLNPITSTTAGSKSTNKAKRGLDETVPLNWKVKLESHQAGDVVHHINADRLWYAKRNGNRAAPESGIYAKFFFKSRWIGLGMVGLGGLLYLGPRWMGIQL